MLIFDVNDKQIEVPSSWSEAKLKVFQNFYRECKEGDDTVKIFAAITSTQYSAVYESTSEVLESAIYQAVAFVLNEPQTFRKAPMPNAVKIAGKTVKIPRQLARLTVGQNFHMRAALATAKNLESVLSIAIAIYLQPLIDQGKFDYGRAREIEKEVLEMNIYDAYPVGFFLLSKLTHFGANGLLSWLRKKLSNLNRMNFWLARQVSTN